MNNAIRTPDQPIRVGYQAWDISPTNLLAGEQAEGAIQRDRILHQRFYTECEDEEKQELYRCFLFLYGFLGAPRHNWKVETGSMPNATTIDLPPGGGSATQRIALVRQLTDKGSGSRTRLLSILNIEGDKDLLTSQESCDFVDKYFRCLLRFFEKDNTLGFQEDMSSVIHSCLCIQKFENCFVIAGCDLVDLKFQSTCQNDAQKRQCLDKAQVARRTMSNEDLCKYVLDNNGSSSLQVVAKLLGGENSVIRFCHDVMGNVFDDQAGIEYVLNRFLRQSGPGLIAFDSEQLRSTENPDLFRIPCFDSFEDDPVKHVHLTEPVMDEDTKVERQMGSGSGTISPPRTALNANGRLSRPEESTTPSLPGLQSSDSSLSSLASLQSQNSNLDIPLGNDENNEDPKSKFVNFVNFVTESFRSLSGYAYSSWFGHDPQTQSNSPFEVPLEDGQHDLDLDATSMNVPRASGAHQYPLLPDAQQQVLNGGTRHSVVYIGSYSDDDSKTWYLMKNSWKGMPLFLVSANCLKIANANAAFINCSSRPHDSYKRTNRRYTECSSPIVDHSGNWERQDRDRDFSGFG